MTAPHADALTRYFVAFRRRWWLAVAAFVLPLVVFGVYVKTKPVVYEATAVIRALPPQRPTPNTPDGDSEILLWLTSRTCRERAGVLERESISATRPRGIPGVELTVRAPSADRAMRVAELAIAYTREAVRRRETELARAQRIALTLTLRQLAWNRTEAEAVAAAMEDAQRAAIGVDIVDPPSVGRARPVTDGLVGLAVLCSAMFAFGCVCVSAWWDGIRPTLRTLREAA